MQRVPHHLFLCVVVTLLASLVACGQAPSQAGQSAAITIEVTDTGLKVPAEVPSGIVNVIYKNSTATPASPTVGWLNEGRTVAEFEQALQGEDFPAILEMANTPGGVELEPGASAQVTYDLTAAELLVVNFPDNGPPQMATTLVKPEDNRMASPKAEIKAEMTDFSFVMPDEIPAGPRLWEIKNTGQQWHHLIVVKLNEGTTIEEVIALAASEEEPEGPPPYKQVAYYGDMSGGTTAWATLDIPAGEYYAICFMPNIATQDMASHAAHGMVRKLVVK
jgi:hypothetical protein